METQIVFRDKLYSRSEGIVEWMQGINLEIMKEEIVEEISFFCNNCPLSNEFAFKILEFVFLNVTLDDLFRDYVLLTLVPNCPYLIFRLLDSNLINLEELNNSIKKDYHFHDLFVYSNMIPDFQETISKYSKITSINQMYKSYQKNYHPHYPFYVIHGYFENSAELYVKYDDIDSIMKLSTMNWKQVPLLHTPQLKSDCKNFLSLAAIFGSIKSFKFFLMNNLIFGTDTADCSLLSNNIEMVRLCEQENSFTQQSLINALCVNSMELYTWLVNEKQMSLSDPSCLIQSRNNRYLIDLIKQSKPEMKNRFLYEAIYSKNYYLTEFLIRDGVDINQINTNV